MSSSLTVEPARSTAPIDTDVLIRVENLGKCYQIYDKPQHRLWQGLFRGRKQFFREFWALKDVSFEVRRGETVGIIGRNGSGKSTLLQLICGTLTPTSGAVDIGGRIGALLELGAGFSPEFTGRENVYMNASILGLSPEEIDSRYEDIVDFAEVGDFIDQPLKTYSSGMYVRLAFAVIANIEADILVIDEALSVGDAFFVQKCMRYLRSFMERGTLVFVSHDSGAVVNLCDRAIWLERGQVRGSGSAKEVCDDYLAGSVEAVQGQSSTSLGQKTRPVIPRNSHWPRDMRQDFVNTSALRNDIEIVDHDVTSAQFGLGGGLIKSAELRDTDGAPLAWCVGGEEVVLRVEVDATKDIAAPIVGYYFRDRLGQNLFGDNTCITASQRPISLKSGQRFVVEFRFRMPILPVGDYTLTVAFAEGTQTEHIQHHWIHDALLVRSHTSSACTGLVGIPVESIECWVYSPTNVKLESSICSPQ